MKKLRKLTLIIVCCNLIYINWYMRIYIYKKNITPSQMSSGKSWHLHFFIFKVPLATETL